MKHARSDYDRIQDPSGLIPDDEPVFLIRGQDKLAPSVLAFWAVLAEQNGAGPEIVKAVLGQRDSMIAWQQERGSKTPDMPKGAGKLADATTKSKDSPL